MPRLEVPVLHRKLYATGDVLLRVELDVNLKTATGGWEPEILLVDSGTEITTFPAWLAQSYDLPIPQQPSRHVTHTQTGLEVRSGLLRFQIVGLDQTEYVVPCFFLGDPNSRPSVNAPASVTPRLLLQPLQLLDGLLRDEERSDSESRLRHDGDRNGIGRDAGAVGWALPTYGDRR